MADLFTRLVSGPVAGPVASAAPLMPRVPSPHEPLPEVEVSPLAEHLREPRSLVAPDVAEPVAAPRRLRQVEVVRRQEAADSQRRLEARPPVTAPLGPERGEVNAESVSRSESGSVSESGSSGDLVRIWLPQRPETYKISPTRPAELRPREAEPALPRPAPRSRHLPPREREPERTTVRIE